MILTLVAFLTTRVQSPTEDDRAKLHKGIGCIIGTIGLSLTLDTYVNASFATHNSDMKSHTGVFITLGKGAFYCRSSKQKLVTKSSTEAELVGISDALPKISHHACSNLGRQSVYDMPSENWSIMQRTIETHRNPFLLDTRLPNLRASHSGAFAYRQDDR